MLACANENKTWVNKYSPIPVVLKLKSDFI